MDVCPLCQEIAAEQGWVKEGSPTTPTFEEEPRRRRFNLGAFLDPRRAAPEDTVAPDPILRRLSESERAMVEAADLFNASPYRRTVGGIGKSLGKPHASVVPLSGVNTEVVVTVAWDISWYQYRVLFDSAQPVRLVTSSTSWSPLSGRGTRRSMRTAGSSLRSPASSGGPTIGAG